ncbi:T9SS type A sorting domain-containing protein [Neolewinella litorea]|uniref:T9SS type A sorting domain-containing protein n=1 Tax=Neolewinella litorea TaxID=2562452 RepID=A0A4V3XLF6_9BACT|nr:T9SS type A sorting domain-containing protein [Neolewinella litorea]THH40673.1 T9SS type A sorting domain-containing protein [Neolewinella litorea]
MLFFYRCLVGALLLPIGLHAQKGVPIPFDERGTCFLPPVYSEHTYSRPYTFREGIRPKALTYAINYLTTGDTLQGRLCSPWPDSARNAFEYAAAIWSDVLQNDQPINVDACYSLDMPAGTLGSTSPSLRAIGPIHGRDAVIYPQTMAEQIVNGQFEGADMNVFINGNFAPNFYFGTDALPPSGKIDFVTLTLHEMGHGLGFLGTARIDDGSPATGMECDGVAGNGCLGYYFSAGANPATYHPSIYDIFVDLGTDTSALTALLPNPGAGVAAALQGDSAGLFYDETNLSTYQSGSGRYQLYAPATFRRGSSFSHFADPSEVMYYALSYGNANHDVGTAATVLNHMGWPEAAAGLPVEWLAFSGAVADRGIQLDWATAAESDNAGFGVEVSRNGGPFIPIGRVAGRGTTRSPSDYRFLDLLPAAGDNHYRLRQTDFDGRETLSEVISVPFAVVANQVSEVYPNPVRARRASIDYLSETSRPVRVSVLDAAGRTLHSRNHPLQAGANRLDLNLAGLAAGVYFLRLEDGRQPVHRRVVVE